MEQKLIETLKIHYTAEIARAEANLLIYFKNPAGIGEHPNVIGEMAKLVDALSSARGSLTVVNSLIQAPQPEGSMAPPAPPVDPAVDESASK